jgi:hypothetical protein
MSAPYISWAFQQRGLTPAQRVVLIALCDRANGDRVCFPSFPTIAADCELSERAVYCAVQYLCSERGLIAKVTDRSERAEIFAKAGARAKTLANVYRILRPADEASMNGQHYTPVKSAPKEHIPSHTPVNPAPLNGQTPAKSAGQPLQNIPQTPAADASESKKGNLRTEPTRARAREAASVLRFSPVGRKSPPATAAPEPEPPPDREPTAAEIEANRKRTLDDIAAMPAPIAAAVRRLANAFEHRYHGPGRWPELTVEAQKAELESPRIKAAPLSAAHLAAARAAAGIRITAHAVRL